MNKTKIIGMAMALIAAVGITGCQAPAGNVAVPSSHIVGNLDAGTFDLLLPKDHTVHKLLVNRTGSNIVVRIEDLKSNNNADVVGQSYAGQIALMQAQAAAWLAAFQAGLSAAGPLIAGASAQQMRMVVTTNWVPVFTKP